MASSQEPPATYPTRIRLLSLNCWGLKYISKYRRERLKEIGAQISTSDPAPDIVSLQECWTQQDYQSIREQTRHILPHAKYYFSGIFGGGLAILSRWPIEESSMFPYPLNGRPTAFWRGDWYVGKGVAYARIRIGPLAHDVVQVFNTHLHAPYAGPNASGAYMEHRSSQAWEIAKLLRRAGDCGHLVLGMGDFNIVPHSLAHRIISTHGGVQDIWRMLHPDSAGAAGENRKDQNRRQEEGKAAPTALFNLTENGTTCDSALNTWRWETRMRKQLHKGEPVAKVEDLHAAPDAKAKRLDYIFLGTAGAETVQRRRWTVEAANVGMTMRHPTLRCSLSDHFSIEATISCTGLGGADLGRGLAQAHYLPPAAYNKLLFLAESCMARAHWQRSCRLGHFGLSFAVSIGCLVAIWWSPTNYVSFILTMLSTLGLSIGVVDGLIGGLFFSHEIRALKEWEWELKNAKEAAIRFKTGREAGTREEEGARGNRIDLEDWKDDI